MFFSYIRTHGHANANEHTYESQNNKWTKNDIMFLWTSSFATLFVFTVSDMSYKHIYTLMHVTNTALHITRKKMMIWMPLKWTVDEQQKYVLYMCMSLCLYTCFVSIKQSKHSQLNWSKLKFPITFESTIFFLQSSLCTLFVCHLNFYGFFLFTLNILLYAFTYTLASYIAHNDKITLCPSFVHIRTQAKNINCLCIFADISRYFFFS